jgi:hypothetical protein
MPSRLVVFCSGFVDFRRIPAAVIGIFPAPVRDFSRDKKDLTNGAEGEPLARPSSSSGCRLHKPGTQKSKVKSQKSKVRSTK